ncbi:MAG: response regulator transcription factor [Alistipes sp.]|nr:response regulator transcription factor [Alistipes sp.]MBQ3209710.1 response regulator transcription factor [Alistipes sp.]MBQ6870475.1 response regulator transcription factor [Alistipes sp.]MBQ9963007.1 response regulator transcription factor [Alistipes sp.]
MSRRILIVDDEDDIREFIGYNLRREGYDISTASNGKEAVEIARTTLPHLILLDMMMPIMDGRQTCEAIRQIPELNDTIIVFLSAVQEEQCQIESYLAGADDYITKPVSMRILCSRVNAIMKRIKPTVTPSCSVDSARRVVITPQGELTLPRKEFEIVELLLSDPGKVFTREEIFSQIWGGEVVVGDRTLDVHIRRLRRKLGDDTITTHKGIGFKIEI